MSLVRTQSIFKTLSDLNEIDLINHIHRIRAQTKELEITGVITYRAGLFAAHAEGQSENMEVFSKYLLDNYTLKDANSLAIYSRKYTGINMSFVGEDQPLVNEPLLDWGIEDKKIIFPHELISKIFETNRQRIS